MQLVGGFMRICSRSSANTLVVIAAAVLLNTHLSGPRQDLYPIVTENGDALPSLFVGVTPNKEYAKLLAQSQTRLSCSDSTVGAKISSLFRVQTVLAQSCGSQGTCGGHFMTEYPVPCEYACGGYRTYFYSNSSYASYGDGWYYTGDYDCNGSCACQQSPCFQ
jgi:hypothetical protein